MPKPPYRCLYNHEMLILFTSQTPYQSYREPVHDDQVRGCVAELAGTGVDALMCCPTAWRAVLWPSDVDPRWRTEDVGRVEPPRQCDLKYYEKAYWRVREYMIQGKDPVRITRDAAREAGLAFFFSYRMNDHHHLWDRECPTHDRFWREHPEFWVDPARGSYFNYVRPEVRAYYLALLTELCERYQPQGLELDFMRSPCYFPADQREEGGAAMSEFVRSVRAMLDRLGAVEGRRLDLCVRLPHTLRKCLDTGLDAEAWARDGLVDMVNISPYFIATPELALAEFREHVSRPALYAEMHFITQSGRRPIGGFTNNYLQKTTVEQYETLALEFLARGVDGLSFFNFAYCRDHSFGEARRLEFPGAEPPFPMLRTITDAGELASKPRHYFLNDSFEALPLRLTPGVRREAEIAVSSAAPCSTTAMLRIETKEPCWRVPFDVELNGTRLTRSNFVGELFIPFTREGLPDPRNVEHFVVPLESIQPGANRVAVTVRADHPSHAVTWIRLELAVYTDAKPW